MKHICDNDTSGLRESRSPVNEMTVQDRCGRRNELPPVLQFLSANKWGEAYSACLLADKAVQRIRRIFLMQRIPKAINKKRLVRYKEGAEMYSMGMNKFQSLAKDAGAILKIDRMVLVDLDTFDQYLESFRVK